MKELKRTPGAAYRLAGLCALAALALHGVGATLGQADDPGLRDHSVLCHLPLLLPDLPAGEVPTLVVAGTVTEDAGPPVAAAPRSAHLSRGPPV